MGKKEKNMITPPWLVKSFFHCSLILFLVGGMAIYQNGSYRTRVVVHLVDDEQQQEINGNKRVEGGVGNSSEVMGAKCDLFSGHWVYDNRSKYEYPLYRESKCSFMFGDLACTQFGRLDHKYQHWRWQPHGCDLPRFDAKKLLEGLRGKRLVFVGDSINRNQWVSMVCMLESSIPPGFKFKHMKGSLYTFKATEYNASIDFYWAPLLVESNSDDPSKHRVDDRILRIRSIEKHAKNWANADILIFNSYLWWRMPTFKVLNGSFEDPNSVYKVVNNRRCYKMALKTWADWLDTHINRTNTQLFFVTMSATHHKAYEWGMAKDQTCLNETEPITKDGFTESGSDPKMMRILESSLDKLRGKGLNVQMLNITQLTQYRKDGHPSVYKKQWRPLPKEKLSNPQSYADCTHWCLPGVPDVWNELLATYINSSL